MLHYCGNCTCVTNFVCRDWISSEAVPMLCTGSSVFRSRQLVSCMKRISSVVEITIPAQKQGCKGKEQFVKDSNDNCTVNVKNKITCAKLIDFNKAMLEE